MPALERLRWVVEMEFVSLVRATTTIFRDKLRVVLVDGPYIDFWWSRSIPDRYALHWERSHLDGTIYRHDNMPHPQWQQVASFPSTFMLGPADSDGKPYGRQSRGGCAGVPHFRPEQNSFGELMDRIRWHPRCFRTHAYTAARFCARSCSLVSASISASRRSYRCLRGRPECLDRA
jgi:hypothetical protein